MYLLQNINISLYYTSKQVVFCQKINDEPNARSTDLSQQGTVHFYLPYTDKNHEKNTDFLTNFVSVPQSSEIWGMVLVKSGATFFLLLFLFGKINSKKWEISQELRTTFL